MLIWRRVEQGYFRKGMRSQVLPLVGWPGEDTEDDASLDEFPHRQLPVPVLERIPHAVVFEDTSSDEASSNEEGELVSTTEHSIVTLSRTESVLSLSGQLDGELSEDSMLQQRDSCGNALHDAYISLPWRMFPHLMPQTRRLGG